MAKKNNTKISKKISKNKINKKIKGKIDYFLSFCRNHYTISFKILLAYIAFVLIGAILLILPISFEGGILERTDGKRFEFWDALFISSSAFSNTGLTITEPVSTFSLFGEIVIYIWIQLGGFGLLSTFYIIGQSINKISKKKILSSSLISHAERGGTKISNNGKILFSIFVINIFIQVIFSFIFTLIFYNIKFNEVIVVDGQWIETSNILPMYNNFGQSFWNGIFITGSSINNAGFDLFGGTSLAHFRNDIGILVQFLSLILFVFGGIGYIVIYDIWRKIEYLLFRINPKWFSKYFKNNSNIFLNEKPEISVFSKICLWASLIFGLASVGLIFIVEYIVLSNGQVNSLLAEKEYFNNSTVNSNWSIIFNTLATRSAGFSTVNMDIFSGITKWIFIFLMFLGTSPSSTGGGIRTTTFVILLKSISSKIKGFREINIFKKRITKRNIVDSTNIFSISIITISILTIIISMISIGNSQLINNDISDIFFEASSAFGTTGLSVNVTSKLDYLAYAPIIILMFFGQLGIINSIQLFASSSKKAELISYPDVEIKLG